MMTTMTSSSSKSVRAGVSLAQLGHLNANALFTYIYMQMSFSHDEKEKRTGDARESTKATRSRALALSCAARVLRIKNSRHAMPEDNYRIACTNVAIG